MAVSIKVNGTIRKLECDPQTPLLWALRDEVGLTGSKFGCGIGYCGACTVLVGDAAIRSCVTPISTLEDQSVTTIEGLSKNTDHPLQKAWIEEDVPQCGYCQSGMILAAAALLKTTPKPTDADIHSGVTNLCRCGSYDRVRRAIKRASQV